MNHSINDTATQFKMNTIAQLMLQAPEPSVQYMESQFRYDMQRNPHNDSYKPRRRSELQIITEYKKEWVTAHYNAVLELGRN